MILKLKRLLNYSKTERKEVILRRLSSLPFNYFSALKLDNRLALSFLPDSIAHEKAYPDLETLYAKFRKKNKKIMAVKKRFFLKINWKAILQN